MEMELADNDAKYAKITVRTTDGSNLTGKVYLGDQDRVSDLFTQAEKPFIVLVNYEHRTGSGDAIFINKTQIVWVVPED